jgi:outer membrane protein
MKNLSLVLNIVLLVAVLVLFYLHFSGPKTQSAVSGTDSSAAYDFKIAYINSDTVLKYYDYWKVNREKLEGKGKKLNDDYRNRVLALQSEIQAYQRNVSSMTLGQARSAEEDLGKKQQNLQLYEQSLSQQMMQEQGKLNEELYDRITSFLKTYGKEKGLQVVLKYDQTSDVLFGNDPLDISQDVIKGLNEAYKTENAKADSTAKK